VTTDIGNERWHLARDVPDTRSSGCKRGDFAGDLPTVSIVICHRNESSVLLERTVHTIFKRTAESLLDKIVLVDDNGDLDSSDPYSQNTKKMAEMLEKLALTPKIELVKNAKTEGLIRARTIGADRVTGMRFIIHLFVPDLRMSDLFPHTLTPPYFSHCHCVEWRLSCQILASFCFSTVTAR